MASSKKEDIAGNPMYRIIARHSFTELHGNLLKILCDFFKNRQGKHKLVVAGQGPEVVPFSRNIDLLEEMIGNGNVAMFDYNPDIILGSVEALINPKFDPDENVRQIKKYGLFENSRDYTLYAPSNLFQLIEKTKQSIKKTPDEGDLRRIIELERKLKHYESQERLIIEDFNEGIDLSQGNRKVIITKGDLAKKFKFIDESISAFDATLAIHHATAYSQGLAHIIGEVYRVLEHEGLFHWGTGNVNMRYQEEKINLIAHDVKSFYNSDVALEDRRDFDSEKDVENAEIQHRAFYSKNIEYKLVPLKSKAEYDKLKSQSDNFILMDIRKDGLIEIKVSNKPKDFESYLREKGYKQVYRRNNLIAVPIIDQGMQKDRELFIESVRNYYMAIIKLHKDIFSDKQDLFEMVNKADNKEFGDASRGLFEYYTDPQIILNLLKEKGFRDINYQSDARGIWCNITAVK